MNARLLAVGARQPRWIEDGFTDYVRRLPRGNALALEPVPAAPGDMAARRAREVEGAKLLDRIGTRDRVVVLDVRGEALSTAALVGKLEGWRMDGRKVTFVIGGANGLSEPVLTRADFTWSLSALTFPYGLARVLVAEQVYRAWAILAGHPYHRGGDS